MTKHYEYETSSHKMNKKYKGKRIAAKKQRAEMIKFGAKTVVV